ncbi:MAG: hypothetical protein JWM47_4068, partial [Acidimicrobiales bacterium]|nr:hypothetical protein [Acidimicrobiales bacterium]
VQRHAVPLGLGQQMPAGFRQPRGVLPADGAQVRPQLRFPEAPFFGIAGEAENTLLYERSHM